MSTRSTVHFVDDYHPSPSCPIVYRHSDGYPDVGGRDLISFLEESAELDDPRFREPTNLSARFVSWLFDLFYERAVDRAEGSDFVDPPEATIDQLDIGIKNADPGDIEYRYTVHCERQSDGEIPRVLVSNLREARDLQEVLDEIDSGREEPGFF